MKKINYERLFLQNKLDIIIEYIDFGNFFDEKEIKIKNLGIINDKQTCKCGSEMFVDFCSIRKFKEGIYFLCNNSRHKCSIYSDSIFYKKKIRPKTFKLILSLWCNSFFAKTCSRIVQQATISLHNSAFYKYYS